MIVYDKERIDNLLNAKQDKLTAGTGINIDDNNVISASGGGGSSISLYQYSICYVHTSGSQFEFRFSFLSKVNVNPLPTISTVQDFIDFITQIYPNFPQQISSTGGQGHFNIPIMCRLSNVVSNTNIIPTDATLSVDIDDTEIPTFSIHFHNPNTTSDEEILLYKKNLSQSVIMFISKIQVA